MSKFEPGDRVIYARHGGNGTTTLRRSDVGKEYVIRRYCPNHDYVELERESEWSDGPLVLTTLLDSVSSWESYLEYVEV